MVKMSKKATFFLKFFNSEKKYACLNFVLNYNHIVIAS